MSHPSFADLSKPVDQVQLPALPSLEPLSPPADVLVPLALTEAELEQDEQREDPLVPVIADCIIDLEAYWGTGMRGALPNSLIRRGVLTRLEAAANSLPQDFGLAVYDAYRPLSLQRKLYSAAYAADPNLPLGYVAVPSENPLTPPPHVSGGAVDLTLTYRGEALTLGSTYEDFVPEAATVAFEDKDSPIRDLRRMLVHAMTAVGFVAHPLEWYHFELGTGRWAAIHNTRPMFGQPMAVADS